MVSFRGKSRKLIAVSNRLPYYKKINDSGEAEWKKASGGLITAMEPIIQEDDGVWIGWDGSSTENAENLEAEVLQINDLIPSKKETKDYKIACVPLTDSEIELYYDRFSNNTLWALFHYFFEKSAIDYEAWNTYRHINKRFALYIDQIASKDDIIWIQDYHLFLTPLYLRKLRPEQEIHFFLHIPFPHIDIFSILPWQKVILESLMSCQSVGFHHKQYLKNFEEAVEQYRMEVHNPLKSPISGHFFVNPISIDFDKINMTSKNAEVIRRKDQIRKAGRCPKMMLSVDRIDYSKGIKERLLAFEQFLLSYPELRGQFYYYQLIVPSREKVESYRSLKKEVDEIVGRINGEFSTETWAPIHYNYGTVPFDELVSLYSAADIALVTPLRDGMNLVCKEYVTARSDGDGVLILSKFAGASSELRESLIVNPYSIKDIKEAIYHAIHMPIQERQKRMTKMRETIQGHNIDTWMHTCLKNFEKATPELSQR